MINRFWAILAACAAVSLLCACSGTNGAGTSIPAAPQSGAGTTQPQSTSATPSEFQRALDSGHIAASCATAAPGEARCFAYLLTNAGRDMLSATRGTESLPSGYGPRDLQGAYNTTAAAASSGSGKTVAIVDAYDAPNLESDLAVYRSTYGLPACTTANGCFKKVNQSGGTSLPAANASWAQETSLDVDMVSANCPNCKILVVEANSPSFSNLATAVNTAARLGALAISNSYGGSDSYFDIFYASSYSHPGIAITVSAGDSGYGAQSPASYNTVTAVGGTSLHTSPRSETVWSGTGSGCSSYNTKPSWQHDAGCKYRMIADVAYDADPYTGVAVYDSLAYRGYSGWMVFGGTSVGAPAIAAIYALSGNTAGVPASFAYGSAALNDVTSGSNGTCSVSYFCHGQSGYDGPTGNGTPNGVGAF